MGVVEFHRVQAFFQEHREAIFAHLLVAEIHFLGADELPVEFDRDDLLGGIAAAAPC